MGKWAREMENSVFLLVQQLKETKYYKESGGKNSTSLSLTAHTGALKWIVILLAFTAPLKLRSYRCDCTLVRITPSGEVISGYILSRRKLRQEDEQLTQIPMLVPVAELGTRNATLIPWPVGWMHGHLMGACGTLWKLMALSPQTFPLFAC